MLSGYPWSNYDAFLICDHLRHLRTKNDVTADRNDSADFAAAAYVNIAKLGKTRPARFAAWKCATYFLDGG